MKKYFITLSTLLLASAIISFSSCGDGADTTDTNTTTTGTAADQTTADNTTAEVNDGKGIGEIKNVELTYPLDQDMVKRGESIYDMKCAACHRLDDTRVVGPGWAGVTDRRKPEWIMNFITNVDVMLDQDPAAQQMLEECLTRMPNQNISIGDARDLLEFMRKNDGEA